MRLMPACLAASPPATALSIQMPPRFVEGVRHDLDGGCLAARHPEMHHLRLQFLGMDRRAAPTARDIRQVPASTLNLLMEIAPLKGASSIGRYEMHNTNDCTRLANDFIACMTGE